jgi:hypothetical protein
MHAGRQTLIQAGFSGIDVQVITRPDTDGRLLPMIKNMAEYARASGKINHADVHKILYIVEQTVSDGSYLALAPQFIVTAIR